jgi:hypothetical protein
MVRSILPGLGFALPFYLLLGAAQSRYARYEVPLLPVIALWTGRMMVETLNVASIGGTIEQLLKCHRRQAALIVIYTQVVMLTAADCILLLAPMWHPDPRDLAAQWLAQYAPSPTVIAFGGMPWFWTPPVNPLFAMPVRGQWERFTPPQEQARYCFDGGDPLDPTTIALYRPAVVVLSEYEYVDALRLKQPKALAYVNALRRQYNDPIVFMASHPLGGRGAIDGLPTQDLPHDMLYPSPTILIFIRR